MVKSLSATRETPVGSLGWEDPPEKRIATYSSILAWRIPWTEELGGLQSTGSQRVGHDWVTNTHTDTHTHTHTQCQVAENMCSLMFTNLKGKNENSWLSQHSPSFLRTVSLEGYLLTPHFHLHPRPPGPPDKHMTGERGSNAWGLMLCGCQVEILLLFFFLNFY